ncbi:MAG: hypothetical protein FJZ64_01275, partial [Chlamydiae bacterium]|nr:hypothetical protein [Chlamydiota bacterium]
MEKGWIALDIDGTITIEKYSVPRPVRAFLKEKVSEGWNLAIVTGRTFHFASMALSEFDFPYVLLPQNGTIAIQMPEKKILFTRYMSEKMIAQIEKAYEGIPSDFLVYAGFEKKDHCYFRKERFPKEQEGAIREWQERQKETWEAVSEFPLEKLTSFPLAKGFGSFDFLAK